MTLHSIFRLLAFYCLFFEGALFSDSPRLLVALGSRCDFTANELACIVEAHVVRGSEAEMKGKIELAATDKAYFIVLDSPVQKLSAFAESLFYDHITLDEPMQIALLTLEAKKLSVPTTDSNFERISPEDRGRFYDLIIKVSALFDEHQIPFWGISGTLLGAIRHGGMIPWDDDLDVIIRVKDKKRFESLAKNLDEIGLELFIYDNYFYKIFPKNGTAIIQQNGTPYRWKYPFMDVFIVNELNGLVRIVSHNYPEIDLYHAQGNYKGWFLYPEEIGELPALSVPFGPIQLPVPFHPETVLSREYGKDWSDTAYMWYNHSTEEPYKRIKVSVTDYSAPDYILPKHTSQ